MSVTGPNTGFKIVNVDGGPYTQDLGERYVSKEYLLDVYPNLIPGRTTPGLWVWGRNGVFSGIPATFVSGQLGDGTIINKSSPIQIGTLTNWKQVDAGDSLSLAIKTDGTLWAWGYNSPFTAGANFGGGGLGDGTIINRSSPVQIGSLTDWRQVSAGTGFSTAVKTNGTLWAWGSNVVGQLGQGNVTHRSSPVQIGSLTNWKQVDAGYAHSAAITTGGQIYTWGYNNFGQLGDGTVVSKSSPVQIGSLTNWKQVSCGGGLFYAITSAVKTDGTLWIWGNGFFGQLGDGTAVSKSSPIQIGLLTNWKLVSCGDYFSAAIKTDGTLWTWGYNSDGQLGDGTIIHRSSPVQIGSLTNWKLVSCGGENQALAIKTDGTLWAWGEGTEGALGDGTVLSKSSPVQIGSLTTWKQISAGGAFGLSILDGYI